MRLILTAVMFGLLQQPARAQNAAPVSEVIPWTNPLCAYCKRGEYAVIVNDVVFKGRYSYTANPTCIVAPEPLTEMSKAANAAYDAESGDYAGAAKSFLDTAAVRAALSDTARGDLGRWLQGESTAAATCKPICAIMPEGAQWTGAVKMGALNSNVSSPSASFPDDKSEIPDDPTRRGSQQDAISGYSRWTFPSRNGRAVCAAFASWDSGNTKAVQLTVAFRPSPNWRMTPLAQSRSENGRPQDSIPVAFGDRSNWDVGVTSCGLGGSYEAKVQSVMRELNFTSLRPAEVYARASDASYGIAKVFQVFYYDPTTRAAAVALGEYLSQVLRVQFAPAAPGAGAGLNPSLRKKTLFVHVVGGECWTRLTRRVQRY